MYKSLSFNIKLELFYVKVNRIDRNNSSDVGGIFGN